MIDIQSTSPKKNDFADDDLVCHCFGHTKKEIEKDCLDHGGQSAIFKKIASEKKAGSCDCGAKNPKGR